MFDIVCILQLVRLKIMITIDKMQFFQLSKFIHDVPAEVFTDGKLIQVYIFGSKWENKKLDKILVELTWESTLGEF